MKRLGMFIGVFTMLLVSLSNAQQRWERTYGGTSDDESYAVQQTSDGGYIVAGYTRSFGVGNVYLIKTNASGDTLWTRTYGGTSYDEGDAVQQTSEGGYIIAGFTYSFGAGNDDVYLIKTNTGGDTLWTRTYGGTREDRGSSVRQTSDGGYIVAGTTLSFGAGSYDVFLIKTNASGGTLWMRTFGGSSIDRGYSVRQTSEGGYIIAGFTYSFGAGNGDVYLIKTNTGGDTLWTRTYGGTNVDQGRSVQQTQDSGYIIAGTTRSFGVGNEDVYLIKTNASGAILWTKEYGGLYDDGGYSVQQTLDGGFIIAGNTSSFGAGSADVWLIKTNASGDTLWTRTFGGTSYDYGWFVQQTLDGGYIIGGSNHSFGAGNYDVYLIKTDANGNVGMEESRQGDKETRGQGERLRATPNPFTSFAVLPGHEAERFSLYDVSGRKVGTYRGDRVGEGLGPGVYFLRSSDNKDKPLRIVKVR